MKWTDDMLIVFVGVSGWLFIVFMFVLMYAITYLLAFIAIKIKKKWRKLKDESTI